jgi:hypothetical protein
VAHLEAASNRNTIHFLVAIYMAAFRVVTEEWLEHEAEGDLVALQGERQNRLSSLPLDHGHMN